MKPQMNFQFFFMLNKLTNMKMDKYDFIIEHAQNEFVVIDTEIKDLVLLPFHSLSFIDSH